MMTEKDFSEQHIVSLPIDGTLDLHTFKPHEIGSLIPEYLNECITNDIFQVRIVHGKGTGSLRRGVHAVLKRSKIVKGFSLGDENSGGWGATIVALKRQS